MNRIYHPYDTWECFQNGMYKRTCFMDDHKMIHDCMVLLQCPEWLYESMSIITHEWFYSTQQHLTNLNRNRQAYLGQAACCIIHGAPEYITKIAWNEFVSTKQQKEANDVADECIKIWEEKHLRGYFEWQKLELEKMCLKRRKKESHKPSTISKEFT